VAFVSSCDRDTVIVSVGVGGGVMVTVMLIGCDRVFDLSGVKLVVKLSDTDVENVPLRIGVGDFERENVSLDVGLSERSELEISVVPLRDFDDENVLEIWTLRVWLGVDELLSTLERLSVGDGVVDCA